MSDFPKGGDVGATRAWLDRKGFVGLFVGWEADAIIGLERGDVLANGGENGLMLWGLLNTARSNTHVIIPLICESKLLNTILFFGVFCFFISHT